jgi:mannose-6-phosphate isomerase-like protein (cupin superfamily)
MVLAAGVCMGVSGWAWAQAAPAASGAPVLPKGGGVLAFPEMAMRKAPNGSESSAGVGGVLETGEAVKMHASMQPAGAAPVALHVIHHTELIVIREGKVAFDHDGKSETAGPGDVVYVPIGTNHRIRNVGDGPARYVVIGIGGDSK